MTIHTITTLDQLQAMSSYLTDHFVLANDIDASDTYGWNYADGIYNGFGPIGTVANKFQGSFDGAGYTIRNLYINRPSNDYVGLFGYMQALAQQVTNGTFTGNANDWTLAAGWTYNANAVDKDGDGVGTLSQAAGDMVTPIVVGGTYTIQFTISNHTVGTVTPTCGGETLGVRSSDGTFSEEFTATTTDGLAFTPTNTARFTIDTITIYRKHEYKDVKIFEADMTGNDEVGIAAAEIIGLSASKFIVSDIDVSGDVDTGTSTSANGSGFAWELTHCDVDDCTSEVDITTYASAGGFTGSGYGSTIDGCRASGSITRSGAQTAGQLGGFCTNAGTASGGTTITSCAASVSILDLNTYTGTSYVKIGGFSATGFDGTYNSCIAYCNIVKTGTGYGVVGGFFGANTTGSADFDKCAASGSISWTDPTASNLGGGTAIGGFGGFIIEDCDDCYAWVDICESGMNTDDVQIGGFAGVTSTGSAITTSYSVGSVPTGDNAGGFTGYKYDGTETDCFWDTETSGQSSAVGTLKSGEVDTGITGETTANMKLQATYTNFNFNTIWEITTFEQPATAATNLTVWMSKTDDYDSFETGTNDDDSLSITIPTTNEIRWIGALESLLVGTAGEEWRVGSNKLDTAITPTNFKVEQQTEYGSSSIQPLKVNASLIFVDFVGRKLREMTFVDSKYESPDLTALAEHVTYSGITSIARQKNPDSIIWCTLDDGSLISLTYEREQNVVAWATHPLGGTDVVAQSVCVIPGASEDEVYLTVERTIDSATVVYMEKLASRVFTDVEDAYFVDCGITFTSGSPTATITGLAHLEGETVQILGDGVVLTEATVASGQVTASTTVSKAQVGLTYAYKLRPMRIQVGTDDGVSLGSNIRISEIMVSFLNTLGSQYATDITDYNTDDDASDAEDFNFDREELVNDTEIDDLYTGDIVVSMPSGFSVQTPIYIVGSDPLPCTVRCIVARLDVTGR